MLRPTYVASVEVTTTLISVQIGGSTRPDRVMVFMDYQNVHNWARKMFHGYGSDPAAGHVFPQKVGELLVSRRNRPSELAGVRVYRGRPNPSKQAGAARANDRQTSDWELSTKTTVIRRNVQYPPGWPTQKASEKGIDVAIAVDMIRLAMTGAYDAAILFSSDNDLLPAVEVLWDLPSVSVEVARWSGAHRLKMVNTKALWCHNLDRSDYDRVKDVFDYAARP